MKKLGIGSPSQSTFRFFLSGGPVKLGKTENRQVWIDFPYPYLKKSFLHCILIDIVWKLKKAILASATEREPGSFLQSGSDLYKSA